MINVGGFDANGTPFAYTSLPLWQDAGATGISSGAHAEWMPYQKGQAAKTEALETAMKVSDAELVLTKAKPE